MLLSEGLQTKITETPSGLRRNTLQAYKDYPKDKFLEKHSSICRDAAAIEVGVGHTTGGVQHQRRGGRCVRGPMGDGNCMNRGQGIRAGAGVGWRRERREDLGRVESHKRERGAAGFPVAGERRGGQTSRVQQARDGGR